jgi:hypothetical protein
MTGQRSSKLMTASLPSNVDRDSHYCGFYWFFVFNFVVVGFFVLMGLGFELRASCLQSRYSTT